MAKRKKKALKRPKGSHGSIYKYDDGVYFIRVQRGVKRVKRLDGKVLPGEGLPRVHSESFSAASDNAAWERANEIWKEMGEDANLGDKISLNDYWSDIYTPDHLSRRRKTTQSGYESLWRLYIAPAFGNKWPADISHREFQSFIDSIESPTTQRAVVRVLRTVVNNMRSDLRISDYIGVLTDKLEYRPKVRRRRETWSEEELLEAMERLKGHPIERFFLVMVGAGLRRQEALPLIVPEDLSFFGTPKDLKVRIEIRRTWTEEGGIEDLTKTYSAREVIIDEPFASRLQCLMPEQGISEPLAPNLAPYAAKVGNGKPERWFANTDIPSYTPDGVTSAWTKLFKPPKRYKNHGTDAQIGAGPLYGMRRITLEALRNTNVSIGIKGGSPSDISALAHGHSQQIAYEHYLGTEGAAAEHAAAVRRRLEKATG